MTVSSDVESSQNSLLCGCCKFGSKKRRMNETNESKLFEPSTSISPSNVAETIPKIVISTPTSAKYFNPRGVETSRSEVFATARTSRVEDTQQYATMSDLVRSIREEAGFGDDTPRPTTTATQVGITVSELRIEGLPELTANTREAPLPSPSREFYGVSSSSSHVITIKDGPSTVAQRKYQPSINRKLGDLTVNVYNTFWRVYYLFIATIALILERILPI